MNKPNADSANNDSLAGGVDAFLAGWVRDNLDDMLPAVVVSYDSDKNRAALQPLVMIGTTDGSKKPRARIENVPVFRYGAGGFFQRFPVKAGDFGWIKANDRDISLVLQRGGQQDWPNTKRRHNFSDAMFFPDTIKDWVVSSEDTGAATIQTLDGKSCLSVRESQVEMRSDRNISRSGFTEFGVTPGRSERFVASKNPDDLLTSDSLEATIENTASVLAGTYSVRALLCVTTGAANETWDGIGVIVGGAVTFQLFTPYTSGPSSGITPEFVVSPGLTISTPGVLGASAIIDIVRGTP